ncbi:MAG: MBOAT family protein [Ruminococcus sp.]|nr:MBOAT family protein [Candidatus Copronaster equi]
MASSLAFYLLSSIKGIAFIVATALTIYLATLWIDKITSGQKLYFKQNKESLTKEEKSKIKAKNARKKRAILICTLLLNFGVMCVVKYSHFAIDTVNSLFNSGFDNSFSLIVPLGLSFYTFQATGYLINVYWDNYKPEKNPLKVLLFVSFFPGITQGPISEYEQLSKELFTPHTFTYKNYSWGFQRMLWGFVKKMVIANSLSPFVLDVFENYNSYSGISCLIGAFLYSIQIYADFSGYMDIMCGYCEMLGITLAENFERPYFSKSVAEYWRRWHITLGAWFKSYIYYPIAISKWNRKFGKNLTEKFGKAIGANLPATIALVAVWLTTGLWHGATWAYVAWGGVNGLFIIFSMWMEPLYEKTKNALHIKGDSKYWRIFSVLRTFVLVTFIKVLPEVGTLSDGVGLWKRIFTNHSVTLSYKGLFPFIHIKRKLILIVILLLIVVWFFISIKQRKRPVRVYFNSLPIAVRIICELLLFFAIAYIGIQASLTEVFMYAGF